MLHVHVATALKNHPLYSNFVQVKNKLSGRGYKCWIAGGAVRDFILNRIPTDFDLVTDATTNQILELFPDAIPVGLQFGVVKIPLTNLTAGSQADSQLFDLTTFRRESDYRDGRRPSQIDFASPDEDALRRDFTINALFWDDENKQIIDYVGGLKDIEAKIIRCVGSAQVRFQEDHLRIIRLLRLSTQLKFKVECETLAAAIRLVALTDQVSGERLWSEIQKMLPFMEWQTFFSNQLSLQIFEIVFPVQISKFNSLEFVNQTSDHQLQFFHFLLLTQTDQKKVTDCLKHKLRVSKNELKIFETLRFCLDCRFSESEWVYQAEKNLLVLNVLKYFGKTGRWATNEVDSIEEKFNNRPAKLVDGNDLKGLVPPEQMTDTLKKIRLLQLSQPYLDKESLLKSIN